VIHLGSQIEGVCDTSVLAIGIDICRRLQEALPRGCGAHVES
jgi:hypothetical protein